MLTSVIDFSYLVLLFHMYVVIIADYNVNQEFMFYPKANPFP